MNVQWVSLTEWRWYCYWPGERDRIWIYPTSYIYIDKTIFVVSILKSSFDLDQQTDLDTNEGDFAESNENCLILSLNDQSSQLNSTTTAIASSTSSPLTVTTGSTTVNQLNLSILNPNQNLLNTAYNRPIGSERENFHVSKSSSRAKAVYVDFTHSDPNRIKTSKNFPCRIWMRICWAHSTRTWAYNNKIKQQKQ